MSSVQIGTFHENHRRQTGWGDRQRQTLYKLADEVLDEAVHAVRDPRNGFSEAARKRAALSLQDRRPYSM